MVLGEFPTGKLFIVATYDVLPPAQANAVKALPDLSIANDVFPAGLTPVPVNVAVFALLDMLLSNLKT